MVKSGQVFFGWKPRRPERPSGFQNAPARVGNGSPRQARRRSRAAGHRGGRTFPTMSGSDPKRLVQAAKLRRMTRSAPARASSPFNRRPQMRRRPQHRENPRRDQPASQRIRAVRSQHRGPRCRAVSGNVLERHGLGTERLQLDVTGECTTRLERSVPGVPGRHTPLGSHAHQGVGVGIWQPPDCRRY